MLVLFCFKKIRLLKTFETPNYFFWIFVCNGGSNSPGCKALILNLRVWCMKWVNNHLGVRSKSYLSSISINPKLVFPNSTTNPNFPRVSCVNGYFLFIESKQGVVLLPVTGNRIFHQKTLAWNDVSENYRLYVSNKIDSSSYKECQFSYI